LNAKYWQLQASPIPGYSMAGRSRATKPELIHLTSLNRFPDDKPRRRALTIEFFENTQEE
jgi:hypothetical protein